MRRLWILFPILALMLTFSVTLIIRHIEQPNADSSEIQQAVSDNPPRLTLPGEPIPAGERVSEQEAANRMPYQLPSVQHLPGGESLSEVWASPTTEAESRRSLALAFTKDGQPINWESWPGAGQGIVLIVHQETPKLNWETVAEPPFKLVEVHQFQGMGTDPGDQILSDGSMWHYPGSVSWQVGNLTLTIYGEYPLDELLIIAESVHIAGVTP